MTAMPAVAFAFCFFRIAAIGVVDYVSLADDVVSIRLHAIAISRYISREDRGLLVGICPKRCDEVT